MKERELADLLNKLKSLYKGGDTSIDMDEVHDACGGQTDDAYWLGYGHGENYAYKHVLDLIAESEAAND